MDVVSTWRIRELCKDINSLENNGKWKKYTITNDNEIVLITY